jgi:hypothetical protein
LVVVAKNGFNLKDYQRRNRSLYPHNQTWMHSVHKTN